MVELQLHFSLTHKSDLFPSSLTFHFFFFLLFFSHSISAPSALKIHSITQNKGTNLRTYPFIHSFIILSNLILSYLIISTFSSSFRSLSILISFSLFPLFFHFPSFEYLKCLFWWDYFFFSILSSTLFFFYPFYNQNSIWGSKIADKDHSFFS